MLQQKNWIKKNWINFLVNWKLRICLSNRVWTGAITEENSRTALPSWLCIYESESWARTWLNEPGCAVATQGIPPFPDHCYLEIPENVIKFDKNVSSELLKHFYSYPFWLCRTRKLDHDLEKKTQFWKRSGMLQQKIEKGCIQLIDFQWSINWFLNSFIYWGLQPI